ncbi:threonine/serine exporter family protein [Tumebacillus lipolyticus]|uniref:Threonine/serine exporter family protein n=1 Tax=Tumebacillus lipolyticus TaxID=1280370 RepID=A0ABW4ZX61_9BACL
MSKSLEEALDLCLRAGMIMQRCGAETSRVEDTITRLGVAYGVDQVQSFVTPTGIFISVEREGEATRTGMSRVTGSSGINLSKVHMVNDLSRRYARGQVSVEEVFSALDKIEQTKQTYRLRYQHLASAFASGAFAVLFNGGWAEFVVGAFCGWISHFVLGILAERVPYFLGIFFAAFVGVSVAVLGVVVSVATNFEAAIIGAVIPLVPGVAVTNAVRDLMAGELLAGLARAAEAFLIAFAIAAAVAVVLAIRVHGVVS